MPQITIGQVAGQAGVNVETIRFYQRLGLIAEPPKPPGGFRKYPPETVQRVNFIKRAQGLGFSLEEIRQLMALDEPQSCAKTHDLALKKLADVEARLADLSRIRRLLKRLAAECEISRGRIACPIISSLSRPQASPVAGRPTVGPRRRK